MKQTQFKLSPAAVLASRSPNNPLPAQACMRERERARTRTHTHTHTHAHTHNSVWDTMIWLRDLWKC